MRAGLAIIATTLAFALAAPPLAQGHGKGHGRGDPPGQGGQGHGGGQPGHGQPATAPGSVGVSVTIGAPDQLAIRQYYGQQAAMGHCPPGLAKKNNGCLPPGQAKKLWAVGQPLPAGVAYFALPPALLGRLSPAPAGYAYVQVGPDVLLLGIATRMVLSAVGIY